MSSNPAQTKNITTSFGPGKGQVEPVTVAIVNYNGMPDLDETIRSIQALDYSDLRLWLVDDCSTDNSVVHVRAHFPDIQIHVMPENKRFRGKYPLANRVRNQALELADTRLVFLADNDIVMAKNSLRVLVETLRSLPDCAVCTPRILVKGESDTIYSDGTRLHYVCASESLNREARIVRNDEPPKYSLGCGIQLLDREKALEIGGMDEDYVVGWGDDGEFHHRMNMRGYRVYNVPRALVWHPRKAGSFRAVPQVKNRWYFILHMYAFRTLFFAWPALLVYDLFLFGFLSLKGGIKEYFVSLQDVLFHLPRILKKRRRIQKMRILRDRDLMDAGEIYVAPHMLNHPALRIGMKLLNGFFRGYWVLIKRFI